MHLPALSNRRRKAIARLGQRKYRKRTGRTLIEGVRSVEAALAAGAPVVEGVVTQEAAEQSAVRTMLADANVPWYRTDAATMAQLSDVAHAQGVLAVVEQTYVSPEALTEAATVLALDGVQDPGNVGTLLRTAAWFGIEAVLCGPGTADVFHPKVLRAGMGAQWDLRLAATPTLGAALDALQQRGFTHYGADLYGTPAGAWTPQTPAVLVMGSEAHGLSAAVRDRLHEPVALPGAAGRAGVESLNVAVAGGILLYEWAG
ncbi:TrmH family RNA methyltransferase [Salisaeta longa]|uniref:TrmH family RNA methyltransferase n=1 Tax=Salisaeta longa TaxID=503170 RepID=UPI0003B7A344|nr:RNA methyltransferase [Salisaeta longa]